LLIPQDSDSFSIPIYGSDLFASLHSLILYAFPTDLPVGESVGGEQPSVNILDIEYVSANEWRLVGPSSARFSPVGYHFPAWVKNGSQAGEALTGCIMSPFFLDYYSGAGVGGIPLPDLTIKMRVYAFYGCEPRIRPRRRRTSTDIEAGSDKLQHLITNETDHGP
jgi:hypothetical protein